jgi:hypothetical protein
VITVQTPCQGDRGINNAAAFAKMKQGVYIVNCARGGLVDEKDLYDALVSGKVAGAALDVFVEEPPKDNPLIGLENVICTPHLGASTDEAQVNVAVAIAEQICAYLSTGEISGAELPLGFRRAAGGPQPLPEPGREAGQDGFPARQGSHQRGRHRVQWRDSQLQPRPGDPVAPQGAAHADPQRDGQLHQRPLRGQGAGFKVASRKREVKDFTSSSRVDQDGQEEPP